MSHGLKTERITLELTETAVVEDIGVSLDVLTRVRLRGFQLSLDDFGTGYASMEKLTRMPFTEIKLDRGFIVGSRTSEATAKVLRAVVRLARELELRVVAEGVENEKDHELVATLGCDYAQGYLYSRSIPPSDVPDLWHGWGASG